MGLLSFVGDLFGGDDAADAARDASAAEIAFRREGLDYAKSVDAPLVDYRNRALEPLFGFYDPSNPQGQQQFIDQVQSSPFYQRQMDVGEEAILRNQAATGGLRTGNTQQALAGFNTDLLNQNVQQQLSGLASFANPALSTNSISQQYAGIGQTAGQGITAAEQARQNATGQGLGFGLGLLGLL